MGKRRLQDVDGDVRVTDSHFVKAELDRHVDALLSKVGQHTSSNPAARMISDIQYMLCRDDGWMRWTADGEGKVVYLKYKFTSSHWPNHYVMVSGPIGQVSTLVSILRDKINGVDVGTLKPTEDRYFKP